MSVLEKFRVDSREQSPVKEKVTSSARICFSNVRNQSIFVSGCNEVSAYDATWWVEIYPALGFPTFTESPSPPIVKVFIEHNQQFSKKSKNAKRANPCIARINMRQVLANTENDVFFQDYKLLINKNRVVANTTSTEYQNSLSRKLTHNVYNGQHDNSAEIRWDLKKTFAFDCTVIFEPVGNSLKFAGNKIHSRKVKESLCSSERILSLKVIESLFEDDKYADFTFNVRGRIFRAHKCLLAKASEVFDLMFTFEAKNNNCETVDSDPEVFEYFLKFIYANTTPVDEIPAICIDLYILAYQYGIETLKQICLTFIMKTTIESSNVLDLYDFASAYQIEKLVELTWTFIRIEMLEIKETCNPKPLHQVKSIIEKKRRFEEEMRSFIAGDDTSSSTGEPSQKKFKHARIVYQPS